MHINFPPVDDGYIKQKVAMGYYSNPTELVRDAVRRFREMDKQSPLMAALEEGERDIAAGRTVPFTRDFMKKARRRARKKLALGLKPNPDVCP